MRILLVAVLIMILVPFAAQADILNYYGEDGTSGNGINGYQGANSSDSLWDYVYSIGRTGPAVTGIWAIVTPVAPVAHFENAGWNYLYFSAADGGIPTTVPTGTGLTTTSWAKISEIWGESGIVWYTTGVTSPNSFHFQTSEAASPTIQSYDGDSWTNGRITSASPEPGSIALLCLTLGAGGIWRRRRKNRK